MTRRSPSVIGCSTWRKRPTPKRSGSFWRAGCGWKVGGRGSRAVRRRRVDPAAASRCPRTWAPRVLLALATLAPVARAPAQPESPPDRAFGQPLDSKPTEEKRQLQKQFEEAFERSDWPKAEAALRRITEIDKKNFVPPYNLACVL